MSKKKKIAFCLALFIISGLYAVRVYSINQALDCPEYREYNLKTEVPYGNDFINSSDEIIKDYTVKVLDSEILSIDDFYEEYDISYESSEESTKRFVYLVKVSFANNGATSTTDTGVHLWLTPLVSINDYIILDMDYFMRINPNMPGIDFALKPNTCKEMTLVYPINGRYYSSIEEIENANFKLQITEYPIRKVIRIK